MEAVMALTLLAAVAIPYFGFCAMLWKLVKLLNEMSKHK